jgi:hypothetical protein
MNYSDVDDLVNNPLTVIDRLMDGNGGEGFSTVVSKHFEQNLLNLNQEFEKVHLQ